jgi:hypothetical protein
VRNLSIISCLINIMLDKLPHHEESLLQFSLESFILPFNVNNKTSMLVPCEPGSIGIHIYVFTVESQQREGARKTSGTQLLWKTRDPGREDTHIYLVTFENSRLVGARNSSYSQLRGNRAIRAGKVHIFK